MQAKATIAQENKLTPLKKCNILWHTFYSKYIDAEAERLLNFKLAVVYQLQK